jgi:hypothetical protein
MPVCNFKPINYLYVLLTLCYEENKRWKGKEILFYNRDYYCGIGCVSRRQRNIRARRVARVGSPGAPLSCDSRKG